MTESVASRKVNSLQGEVTAVRWFVPVRILSYILILVFGLHAAVVSTPFLSLFITYSLSTLALAATLLFRSTPPSLARTIRLVQFVLELSVLGSITLHVPVLDPRLPVLFLMTIVSASLCFRLVGTLVLATSASLVLAAGSLFHQIIPRYEKLLTAPGEVFGLIPDDTYFGILLQVLTFYLIAFVAGYLAEKLNSLRMENDQVARLLKRVRLETDEILRHLNSGLVTVTADGCIAHLNRAAERMLELDEQVALERMPVANLPPRLSALATIISSAIEHDREQNRFEINTVTTSGQTMPLGTSTSILRNIDGSVRGVIVIFSDLTEAKAMESRIRTADRLAAVGELSASIAHEIRNPLAAISGSVEVLASELTLSGDNRRLMELIVDESERLTRILNEFLSYARIDEPRWGSVELGRLLDDVMTLTRHHKSYRSMIRLVLEPMRDSVRVRTDEQLLKQLLLNLTINALEAMDEGTGTLTMRVEMDEAIGNAAVESTVKLFVHNTGRGIDSEILSRMFEPFFSTKEGGTGLGLAIVHRLAMSLEIPISITSTDADGTSFVLPLMVREVSQGRCAPKTVMVGEAVPA